MAHSRKIFPAHGYFYPDAKFEALRFEWIMFGQPRARIRDVGGRRVEDPFRGLRAGPARSSPQLLPPPTLKTTLIEP